MNALEEILYPVVDEMGPALERPLPKHADTPLLGDETAIDSLDLVEFVLGVEERIETDLGCQVRLTTEDALSRSSGPFRTLGTLAAYVEELLA